MTTTTTTIRATNDARVTRTGALNNDEASSEGRSRAMRDDDGKDGMDVSSPSPSSSSSKMMMTTQKALIDDFLTRAGDAARASAERYDFARAFVGSMLCATIAAVVGEELVQDVERDGGGRR